MVRTRNRPTLKDVAKLSDCSIAVVSTVVNNAKGNTLVSDEMRSRVSQAARDLGYRAHFASRTLKEKRSRTLGIYFPPLPWTGAGYGYEGAMIRGVEQACRELDYDLLLVNMNGGQDSQVCMDKFAESRIDGLVLMNINDAFDHQWVEKLLKLNNNVVAVDYCGRMDHLNAMQFDNATAVRVALEYLQSIGHRRIGFLGSCKERLHEDTVERQQAFGELTEELDLATDSRLIFDHTILGRTVAPDEDTCQIEAEAGAKYFASLGDDRPTAIMGYGDLVAIAMMHQFMAMGIQTPRDISIVGVDDTELCRRVYPTLTSVYHPLPEMGYEAAKYLIGRSSQSEPENSDQANNAYRKLFGPKLVVRNSVRSITS